MIYQFKFFRKKVEKISKFFFRNFQKSKIFQKKNFCESYFFNSLAWFEVGKAKVLYAKDAEAMFFSEKQVLLLLLFFIQILLAA